MSTRRDHDEAEELTAPLAQALTPSATHGTPVAGVSARLRAWWLFAAVWPCVAYMLPLVDVGPDGECYERLSEVRL